MSLLQEIPLPGFMVPLYMRKQEHYLGFDKQCLLPAALPLEAQQMCFMRYITLSSFFLSWRHNKTFTQDKDSESSFPRFVQLHVNLFCLQFILQFHSPFIPYGYFKISVLVSPCIYLPLYSGIYFYFPEQQGCSVQEALSFSFSFLTVLSDFNKFQKTLLCLFHSGWGTSPVSPGKSQTAVPNMV